MFSFFKKDKFMIVAPVNGELFDLKDVPDEMFSQKIMGDGFAVRPKSGVAVAPISGTVETVFPTGHAVGISTKDGIECLVHIGLDTVELNGEGFEALVQPGQKVKAGQEIVKFDKEHLEAKGYQTVTMVIFTSGYNHEFQLGQRSVVAGEQLI